MMKNISQCSLGGIMKFDTFDKILTALLIVSIVSYITLKLTGKIQ